MQIIDVDMSQLSIMITSLQIRRHFFRAHNINVNQYFNSQIIYHIHLFFDMNYRKFFFEFAF